LGYKVRVKCEFQWSGVFSLEGSWNEDLTDRSSVLPMLELLERLEKIDYVHRDVGTRPELEHYLARWIDEDLDYYVLYLAFHGKNTGLWLSDRTDGFVTLDYLAGVLADKLDGCVVHFGSCSVMAAEERALQRFLDQTGARAVTGYLSDVDWVDSALMDLAVMGTLSGYRQLGTALNRLEQAPQYESLRTELGFSVLRSFNDR
jgi:hypothetical protein